MTNTTVRIVLQRTDTATEEFARVDPSSDGRLYVSAAGAMSPKEAILLAEAIRIMAREQESKQ
jgi:hypothetical protein